MISFKHLRIVSLVIFITLSLPASSAIISPVASSSHAVKHEDPRAVQLLQRLDEIKNMDRSELTRLEKKSLRKEVKDIKKELAPIKGGVYLSVGAIIIIILLLILIL